jgi:type I restriction enzyme S subunit
MAEKFSGFANKKLSDIIELKYGKGLPKRSRIPGHFPVYGSGGVVDFHNEALVSGPGIIVGRKGSIGTVFYEKNDFYPIDTVFYVAPKFEDLDLYYLSKLLDQVGFQSLNSDAAVPGLNREVALRQQVKIPPLLTQRKIAGILSAYDDLIENNLRRIKILEEMVQTLYREWFVKFRFPGHQKVKMVNSPMGKIPEGWEVGPLDDVLATLESGSRPKGGIDPEVRGVPSIGAENIIGLGRYDYSKEKFVTREFFNNMNRGHIQSGDILLYKDGAQIGRKSMFRDGFPHVECCINEHVFILRTNGRCSQNYLFFWLDQPEMTQNIINLNANAAQPGINQLGVRGLSILLPPTPLLKIAEQVLETMLGVLFNNAKRNNILRQTRDLLLPKLISGELDVSELDITIPEANA